MAHPTSLNMQYCDLCTIHLPCFTGAVRCLRKPVEVPSIDSTVTLKLKWSQPYTDRGFPQLHHVLVLRVGPFYVGEVAFDPFNGGWVTTNAATATSERLSTKEEAQASLVQYITELGEKGV